jgi:very-short-patch-repair endonuclease
MKTFISRLSMYYGADSQTIRTAIMLRKSMTVPEIILWKKLSDRKIFNTKFRRQHPVSFFIVDFYCHEYKLVIEVDGEIHNESEEYDDNRTAELNKFGIRVLRFTNDDVFTNMDSIIKEILNVITEDPPFSGAGGQGNQG